jgi:two-component system, response regulator, stage 0 sporulation protein F
MAKVMIVEDEVNLLKLYKDELEDEGHEVFPIDNGRKILENLKEFKPEVVVLDIRLGSQEGLEILEQIKNFDRGLPVIINSAYSSYKANFSSWLADDYVVKSPDLTELKDTIRKHTEKQDNSDGSKPMFGHGK